MFNKIGNSTLLIVAAVLALLWAARWWSNRDTGGDTLRATVVQVDTAQLRSFSIAPKQLQHKPLRFERAASGDWSIIDSSITYKADRSTVSKMLGKFVELRAMRLAGTMAKHAGKFELADSSNTLITFHPGTADEITLRCGLVDMAASADGETFVNIVGEEEVHAVPGALTRELDKPRDFWRDHVLIGGDHTEWRSIELTMNGVHGYTLTRSGTEWLLDGQRTNRERVEQYLRSLSEGNSSRYADGANLSGLQPAFQITIRDAQPEPLICEVFNVGDQLVLRTPRHSNTLFAIDGERDMSRLMRPAQYLMGL